MRLKKERKAAKLTQERLADISGVSQSAISKMERGDLLRPSFDVLERLSMALKRRGRSVEPKQLQPRRQPALIKGFKSERRRSVA